MEQEILGKCPMGHIVRTYANDPKEFYQNNPVKSLCLRCNSLVGIWWSPKVDTVPGNWVEKWRKRERF